MSSPIELTRRELLKTLGGGILVLAFGPSVLAQGGESGRQGRGAVPQTISAWIHIGADGKITVMTGKVEVGQNARTSLTAAVAEELRVPVDSIHVIMGDTDLVPFDQGTFGSRTTPSMVPQLRRAAASAREALLDLGAEKWGVARESVRAENGQVINGEPRKTVSYGELAKGQPLDKPIKDVPLAAVGDWKILGKSTPKVNGRDFVTGKHEYTSDLKRPEMLHAKVLRPPSQGATLVFANTAKAEAMAGVKVVKEEAFVAVAAPTLRQAERALFAVEAEWKETPQPSSKDFAKLLRGEGPTLEPPAADSNLKTTTYTCAYIAHVPLEPRAALAEWDGKKMTVHTGTQRPFGVRGEVARALSLPESQVRVIVPDTGSGYGGKHSGDAAIEAARIAKAVGKPIKLVWTRSEEFRFAYFRPGGVVEIAGAANKDGSILSLENHNYNSGGSGLAPPYTTPKGSGRYHQAQSPLRQGSYRGLAATFNIFAIESYIDEIAHAIGMDPLEFRRKNLKEPRLLAALEAAAERFGWGKAKPAKGHGFGLACGTEKGSFVATVAEIAVDSAKTIKVIRAVTAYDCGTVLNPEHCKSQAEGAVVQGLGGALFEEIHYENGKVTDSLTAYRLPRFSDVPILDTFLLNRKDLPSAGAGETPIVTIAPAIGNAVFMATGVRLRSLPMRLP